MWKSNTDLHLSTCLTLILHWHFITATLLPRTHLGVEGIIADEEYNHEEGNRCKPNGEPICSAISQDDIGAAVVDVRFHRTRNPQAKRDRVLHHCRDEGSRHALLLWQDRIGNEDTGGGKGQVRASDNQETGWEDECPVAIRVDCEAHQQVADEEWKHRDAEDVLGANPGDENADWSRGKKTTDDQRDHLCYGSEGRLPPDRENEDGGVVEEDAEGHPAERQCCDDGGETFPSPERVGQDRRRDAGLRVGKYDDEDDADDEKHVSVCLLPSNHWCLIPRKDEQCKTSHPGHTPNVIELLETESWNRRADAMRNDEEAHQTKHQGANCPEPVAPSPGDILREGSTDEATEYIACGCAKP